MKISEVSLAQMLDAREARARVQTELIQKHGKTIICFTMNIAGEVKLDPLILFAFREGLSRIRQSGVEIIDERVTVEVTGCTAYMAAEGDAREIKRKMEAIEDSDAVARLFDIDVITADGEKLSRGDERGCIVCGAPVKACARSRAHGLPAIKHAIHARLVDFAAEKLAGLARDALLFEVSVTPKPGLVDMANNGAHADMDVNTFRKSAAAIAPYYREMAETGADMAGEDYASVMRELRRIGICAETAMLAATGGVNTHRGSIYTIGLLLAGRMRALVNSTDGVVEAAAIAASDAEAELARAKALGQSHGGEVCRSFAVNGVRGEAMCGFPSVVRAKETFARYMADGFSQNDAGVMTLAKTMETLDDTNVLHRGGAAGLQFVWESALRINALEPSERVDAMRELDKRLIEMNLSPGGAADVLAAEWFLYKADEGLDMQFA